MLLMQNINKMMLIWQNAKAAIAVEKLVGQLFETISR